MPAPRVLVLFAVGLSLLLALAAGPPAKAQLSSEEKRKREMFLRAREAIEPAPAATPRPAPVRPQPRPRPGTREEKPAPKRSPVEPPAPEEEKEAAPVEKEPGEFKLPPPQEDVITLPPPRPRATPAATPEKQPDDEVKLPPPRPVVAPAATPGEIKLPPPKPLVTPPPAVAEPPEKAPAAPIVIEKSGLEEDRGLAPVQSGRRGFLGLGGPRYRYLSRSVRAAIDRAPVKRGRWQYIVVHNSGTKQGNARIFSNYHRNVRKMKNGLAYHFVIGNGTSSGNGEIEIGSRWTGQINGGHVASDYLNNIALGICFVGDFNRSQPTPAQLAALEELIRYLRDRVGKSKGRVVIVKAHREINPKPTDCPGDRFPYRWLHRRFD